MDNRERLEPYLKDMRGLGPPPDDDQQRLLRRQRLLPALRVLVGREYDRRRRMWVWRRVGAGLLFFGAATTAVIFSVRSPQKAAIPTVAAVTQEAMIGVAVTQGTLMLNHNGGTRRLAAGEDIGVAAGDTLETATDGKAQVRLASIAAVTLAEGTRVGDLGATGGQVERVTLARGSVHLKVTKLAADRRFHVVTPDAEVQVRGTEFDVTLVAEPKPHTCVRVEEGLVQVTAGHVRKLVGAGQSWGCQPDRPVATAPAVAPPAPRHDRRLRTAQEASDLKIQNTLFQRALRAERSGEYAAARTTYQTLLRRYPTGPLSAQASANLGAMAAPR